MLGFPILFYLRGMRIIMFQLSGFYRRCLIQLDTAFDKAETLNCNNRGKKEQERKQIRRQKVV